MPEWGGLRGPGAKNYVCLFRFVNLILHVSVGKDQSKRLTSCIGTYCTCLSCPFTPLNFVDVDVEVGNNSDVDVYMGVDIRNGGRRSIRSIGRSRDRIDRFDRFDNFSVFVTPSGSSRFVCCQSCSSVRRLEAEKLRKNKTKNFGFFGQFDSIDSIIRLIRSIMRLWAILDRPGDPMVGSSRRRGPY